MENATGYVISRAAAADGPYTNVRTVIGVNEAKISGLEADNFYYYKVTARCEKDGLRYDSLLSSSKYALYHSSMSAGSITCLEQVSDTSVKLTWKAIEGAEGYAISRAESANGPFTLLKRTTAVTATDVNLTPVKTYYYCVKPYKTVEAQKAYGINSKVIDIKLGVKPAVPTAVLTAKTSVKVNWSSLSGYDGYALFSSAGSSSTSNFKLVQKLTAREYTVTGLAPGTTQYFRIRGYKVSNGVTTYGQWSDYVKCSLT